MSCSVFFQDANVQGGRCGVVGHDLALQRRGLRSRYIGVAQRQMWKKQFGDPIEDFHRLGTGPATSVSCPGSREITERSDVGIIVAFGRFAAAQQRKQQFGHTVSFFQVRVAGQNEGLDAQ